MKGYIICATQRSGSTMLCDDLKSTKIAGLPKEYFNKPMKKLKEQANADGKVFLDSLFESASTENGVVGIKVMSNQINRIGEVVKIIFPEYADMKPDEAFFKYFKDFKFVYLKRKNVVKQAVSRFIARGTGVYHLRGKKELPENYGSEVEYNYEELAKEAKKIRRENVKWRKYFKLFDVNFYELEYEKIANNTKYVPDLLQFLEIEGGYEKKPRKTKKVANELADSFVAKYKEDKEKNKGSEGSDEAE
ncbi:MAG: hypothetical protein CMI00_11460 [Oceanospirillaceae bacterium]|nr:hypothetical protein [Oceanospirillaceae bacterium]|tara:strand:+ start:586 stop:1329 length:744 start_codon:yes stop_codon:yes gene_type:complete